MEILKAFEEFGLNVIDEPVSRTQWFKGKKMLHCAESHFSRILEIWRSRSVALLVPLVH